ncbi:MAG: ATP-binding protein [Alphaproteobacteria bacterium]|nr:ATP-binding protein [Alphaproteobacteria bacterium]
MTQSIFPWMPVGFSVGENAKLGRVLATGPAGNTAYQVCDSTDGACLLLKKDAVAPAALATAESALGVAFAETEFGEEVFLTAIFSGDNIPLRVASIPERRDFSSAAQLCDLAGALSQTGDASWGDSLYFPDKRWIFAFGKPEADAKRRELAVRLLTGGVSDPVLSPKQIHALNRWISPVEIKRFYQALGLGEYTAEKVRNKSARPPEEFSLPGQPALEAFFREQIIDYYYRREAYEKMGVHPERGILLHGAPGTGKTYSVQKLAEFLGWEMVEIGMSEVGSKYIHETSLQIRRKFDEARKKAPALVFLDELDALGGSREMSGHDHKVEEINELLKQVEKAGKDGLLVLAATNFLSALDPALIRKGRFDNHIEVCFPKTKEVLAAFENCLSAYPCAAGLNLAGIAKALTGRPLSDIAWLANKAGHIAVKNEKSQIDQECLEQAKKLLPPKSESKEFVGFR